MFVGKPRIDYICLKKKKGKNQLTLCSIKLTWSLLVFHLAWNGSATKKLWLGLQFCRLLQDLQLQYLWMSGNISRLCWLTVEISLTIISPPSVGARCPLEFSKDWSLGVLNKNLYREAPPQGPVFLTLYTLIKLSWILEDFNIRTVKERSTVL